MEGKAFELKGRVIVDFDQCSFDSRSIKEVIDFSCESMLECWSFRQSFEFNFSGTGDK